MQKKPEAIVWFDQVTKQDIPLVGGKGANLGEMTNAKIPVPPGFINPLYDHSAPADEPARFAGPFIHNRFAGPLSCKFAGSACNNASFPFFVSDNDPCRCREAICKRDSLGAARRRCPSLG